MIQDLPVALTELMGKFDASEQGGFFLTETKEGTPFVVDIADKEFVKDLLEKGYTLTFVLLLGY